ncbi:hypothetical protein VNO78_03601 [Psophocarpus tetragonolobus]|uniref:C2H2-type domain-containing protein n=1 Tax=Psophocarpus tetragonolobus TaxID=3891 RepID=A0AAN9T0P7_PSOTE
MSKWNRSPHQENTIRRGTSNLANPKGDYGKCLKMEAGDGEGGLKLEYLRCIDTKRLSQEELMALSLSWQSHCKDRETKTKTNTKIDPALFNESAGSRRQTYSSPTGRRRRLAALLPPLPGHDPENRLIIDHLKHLIREDPKLDQVQLASPSQPPAPAPSPAPARKRGRKPKLKVHLHHCYRGIDFLNHDASPLDLSLLSNSHDPFADHLTRRTLSLRSEADLLAFLRDLPGQWASRRKKRRIVDASLFAHVLPLSWKLLLALKRKDGRASIYCRRFISPSGQHFVSCKEVSSYLHSLLPHLPGTQHSLPPQNSAGVTQEERQIVAVNSDVSANERVKEVALLGIENLADVQIHDLFECRKCNLSFDEKDLYLQHLLSIHQRTTRRYRLGSSVGDGVIIKDGKFECQFCHKVFLERRRYNGHVGIHVRNYVQKRLDDSPAQANSHRTDDNSPLTDHLPLRISKMDALIEIAQNSIMEDSPAPPHTSAKMNRIPASDIAVAYLDQDTNSESPVSEQQMEHSIIEKNVDHDLDGKLEEIDDDNHVIDVKDDVPLTIEELDQSGMDLGDISQSHLFPLSKHQIRPESDKSENSGYANTKGQFKLDEGISNKSELEFGLNGLKDVPVTVITNVQDMVMPASEENVVHSRVFYSSISSKQSLDCLPAFSSDKGGKQFCSVEREHDNVKGFQELRFDKMDTVEYDFARVQDSPTLPDVPTELANNTVMEVTYASSVQVESQEVMPGRNQLTTVCVWCGIEFNHDAGNSEIQPDSVGFMCPACKAKISGQINVLDCGSPNAGCI